MSEENGGESKFGFKDKAKAEETLQLLESHDMQYRKLTVRGLLGRAKRVLSMTKAEEKLKNINEAIEVFQKWIEENASSSNKSAKPENSDKAETVPGLGFKDKEAAEKTLKILKGRDPDYQRLAVKGLLGSSKRVLSGTKNDDKIKAIKAGVQVLEDFLEKFECENLMQYNRPYLAYSLIEKIPTKPTDKLQEEFLDVYGEKSKGNYKHLRTLYPKDDDSTSWDIVRNKHLKELSEEVRDKGIKLFIENSKPSEIHLKMIHWAYSPMSDRLKSYIEGLKSPDKGKKRKTSVSDSDSDSDMSDESPRKKQKA